MTVVRCTQKLLVELRIKLVPETDAHEAGWHANLLRIERRKCVLFAHDETLFSFLLRGLTRPDFEHCAHLFGQGLFKAMLRSGFDTDQIEPMLETTLEIRFAKTNNRSVLGSINDMAQMLEWTINSRGSLAAADPVDLQRLLIEVFLILRNLGEQDPSEMVSPLRSIFDPTNAVVRPAGAKLWLFECISAMRRAIDAWIEEHHNRRRDELEKQFALGRVAAGMNWANKPLDKDGNAVGRNQRLQAMLYAGLSARDYVARFHPDHLDQFLGSEMSVVDRSSQPVSKVNDRELWTRFWDAVDRFSVEDGNRYVLVAEGLGDDERLRTLGKLPWSVVVDLDPYSDDTGLHRHATPVLETQRKVHTFRKPGPEGDLELSRALLVRGTAWMMASGWSLKNEQPLEFNRWRYDRLHEVRSLFGRVAEFVSPDEIYVLVLPGAGLDPSLPLERVARVVTAIEEATRGIARTILLGSARLPGTDNGYLHIPLEVSDAIGFLVENVGTSVAVNVAEVPGRDGPCGLPVEVLRALEENLVVLHSRLRSCKSSNRVVAFSPGCLSSNGTISLSQTS